MKKLVNNIHCFSVSIANEIGLEEAIILSNIAYWIDKNMANDKHFIDGKHWTYNSHSAFLAMFPYLKSRKKIEKILKKLIDFGLIEKGCFNKSAYDRTSWYSLTEKGVETLEQSNGRNLPMDWKDNTNGEEEIYPPIPNRNTYITPDSIKEINKETPSLVGKESELNPPDIGAAPPLVVTDNFEVFWKAYPNKKGKAGALAKWNVLKKQKTLPNIHVILNAIQAQKEWRNTAKQGEFRPEWKHPSTWLNQGCWDDEVEVQQTGKINIKGAMFPRSETFFYNGEYHAIALEAKLYNELKTRGEI